MLESDPSKRPADATGVTKLLGMIDARFADARERRRELVQHPDRVWDALRIGAERGRAKADPLMDRVRAATGLATTPRKSG